MEELSNVHALVRSADDSPMSEWTTEKDLDEMGRLVITLDNFSGKIVLPAGVQVMDAAEKEGDLKIPETPTSECAQVPDLMAEDKNQGLKAPRGRWGASLTVISDDKAVLFGGESEEGLLGTVTLFDLETMAWSDQSEWEGEPRSWHTATYLPSTNHLIVFGGMDEGGDTESAMVFDCDIKLWYPLTTMGPSPGPRSGHSACVIGRKLFFFGGLNGKKELCDLYTLDTKGWRWSKPETQGKQPRARAFHTATTVGGDKMIVIGGRFGAYTFDDVYVLTVSGEEGSGARLEWSCPVITGVPFRRRCGHQSAIFSDSSPNKVLVFGGWDPSSSENDLSSAVLDVDSCHWENSSPDLPKMAEISPSYGHCSIVHISDDGHSSLLSVCGRLSEELYVSVVSVVALSKANDGEEHDVCHAEMDSPRKESRKLKKLTNISSPIRLDGACSSLHQYFSHVTPPKDEQKTVPAHSLRSKKRKFSDSSKPNTRQSPTGTGVPLLDLLVIP